MKTRAPALRRAVHKPLPQAPAHATKPAPRRAATIRKKTKADASRMKAADRRRFVPARLPAAPRGNCLHFATWNVRPSPSDPSRSGWIFLVSFSFGDRVIHGRSKTLMRHCRVGHRRGSFKEKSYRDRVNAVLESVYGSTFSEGAWWYRHPDEDAFFASVFSMASGRAVTAAQAARVFVKNNETRKIELDETAMRAAGVSVAEVAALYEKTPAAAWIAETRGKRAAREAIVVPPLEGGEATAERSERSERSELSLADVRDRPTGISEVARRSSRATESSTSGASETLLRVADASDDDDDDDDDATVVADEFNDDVDLFLGDGEDALPALPAGGDVFPEMERNSAGACVLPDSLGLGELFASQPTRDAADAADAEAPRTTLSRDDFFFKEALASSPARRETRAVTRDGLGGETGHAPPAGESLESLAAAPFERALALGAVRKNMSFLGATAASAVSAKDARRELEKHLARVDRILREQTPHDFSELFSSQGF